MPPKRPRVTKNRRRKRASVRASGRRRVSRRGQRREGAKRKTVVPYSSSAEASSDGEGGIGNASSGANNVADGGGTGSGGDKQAIVSLMKQIAMTLILSTSFGIIAGVAILLIIVFLAVFDFVPVPIAQLLIKQGVSQLEDRWKLKEMRKAGMPKFISLSYRDWFGAEAEMGLVNDGSGQS